MADFLWDPVPVLEPVDVEVRLVSVREQEATVSSLPPSDGTGYGDWMDDSLLKTTLPDPIKIRGVGGSTMFGLNSRFDDCFPPGLVGKVASEEFHSTLGRLNAILQKSIPFNLKCLLCGCLCCFCTLGLSMGPVLYLNKRVCDRERELNTEKLR